MSFFITLIFYTPIAIMILGNSIDRETSKVLIGTDKIVSEIKDVLLQNSVHDQVQNNVHDREVERAEISDILYKYNSIKSDRINVLVNGDEMLYTGIVGPQSYTSSSFVIFWANFIAKQERVKYENSLLATTSATLEKQSDHHLINKLIYDLNHGDHQDRIIIVRDLTEIYAPPVHKALFYGGLIFIFLCSGIAIISYTTQIMRLKEFEKVIEEQQKILGGVGSERYVNVGRKHGELLEKVSDILIDIHVRAQESDIKYENLAQNIAHETSNYLTEIKQSVDIIRYYGLENKEMAEEMLNRIETAALIVSRVQTTFLDLAKLKNRESTDVPAYYNVDELINFAVDDASEQFRDINFVQGDTGEEKNIHIVREHFWMVMKTLLENAAKYSEDSDEVLIEVLNTPEYDGHIAVKITNWGTYIPEAERRRIFERYYRATNVRGTKRGLGLGLNIVEEIVVERYGGWVEVESDVSGETSFIVVFPNEK